MTNNPGQLFGFLNLLKPPGMTSARAVGFVKSFLHGEKIGHAGTLDPEASGVLPLMIGKATRLFDLLQDKQKEYVAEIAFGCATDTQDAQGKVIAVGRSDISEAELLAVLPRFTGEIQQTPPMYSAISQNGARLYELARKGKTVEVPSRPVTVHHLELLRMMRRDGALLRLRCSKGFYVRTLCTDIGTALGTQSHMRFLLRTASGPFRVEDAVTLEEVREAALAGRLQSLLMTPQQVLPSLALVEVPPKLKKAVWNGGVVTAEQFAAPNAIPQQDDLPFGLVYEGRLCAIACRRQNRIINTVWLAEDA